MREAVFLLIQRYCEQLCIHILWGVPVEAFRDILSLLPSPSPSSSPSPSHPSLPLPLPLPLPLSPSLSHSLCLSLTSLPLSLSLSLIVQSVVEHSHLSSDMFVLYLHQNYLQMHSQVDDVVSYTYTFLAS